MFNEFLKRQSHVFLIQLWPDRIRITELTAARFVEDAPLIALEDDGKKPVIKEIGKAARAMAVMENVSVFNPFYGDGYVVSDIDGAVAVINHHIHLLNQELSGKMFSPLMIFQPMEAAEKGDSVDDVDISEMLSKKCGARNVIIMAPDEYLDLDSKDATSI